jgi:hypothetical protein
MPVTVASSPILPGLSPVCGRPIVARFDAACMSSDGGLLALREVERQLMSMAARNSPEVAVENSPLHCGSVSSVAAGRDDFGEFGEVEFGDRLERLGGCAVTEALR